MINNQIIIRSRRPNMNKNNGFVRNRSKRKIELMDPKIFEKHQREAKECTEVEK